MLKIALVGRPNVGKSALFNRICKKKIAIVDSTEGVTRDRIYARSSFFGNEIEVIDTGGIGVSSKIPFQEEIRRQAETAIQEADALIMVVDAHIGITSLDEQVAKILLRSKKPLCLAVNKVDGWEHIDRSLAAFERLGIKDKVAVSAEQGLQIAELIERTCTLTPQTRATPHSTSSTARIAIVGKPNVGKSTLLNALLGKPRCVISPLAGTTRDSIDVEIEKEGATWTLVDTAGLRKRHADASVIDIFSTLRTEQAIEKADICLLMLDAQTGISSYEMRIAKELEAQGKGCILLVNKWDTVKGFRMEHCLKGLQDDASFLKHCPALFISASTGRNLDKIFATVSNVHKERTRRITTGQLNRFMEEATAAYHPPMIQGKRLRIYYLAQVATAPPRFVLFVNQPRLMCDSYHKYLVNRLREAYGFQGVPLLIHLKSRSQQEKT